MSQFTVFGRPGCGFCSAAVSLLKSKNLPFEYIDIYQQGLSSPIELAETLGRPVRTVPQILHGDTYVGGYSELVPYLQSQD